jgi:hypothetical protein
VKVKEERGEGYETNEIILLVIKEQRR